MSWHTLDSWTTVVWNIIQIKLGSEELWPGHRFLVSVHCDLDLGDMTLGQGHYTPLSPGQQLCEILSRSKMAVKNYNGPDRFLVCVHYDLDLGDMTFGQGHNTPLGHGQQLCEILSRFNLIWYVSLFLIGWKIASISVWMKKKTKQATPTSGTSFRCHGIDAIEVNWY